MLWWVTVFVVPVAGRMAEGCWNTYRLNRFTTVSDSHVAALFHKRVHTRVQVDLFEGGILCIDS